jgi:lipoprotein-releasing system ATP-binding protein
MDIILKAEAIVKTFASKGSDSSDLTVLNDVHFEAQLGESIAIMGPSGSGKSTLLHILGGLDRPNKGEVYFKGKSLSSFNSEELAYWRNQEVGFVFQFHHLLPEFTAIENVMIPALIHEKNSSETETKAKRLLERVGLADREHHRPSELSGGEQQRVAVARALMNNPSLLLADEPTGNLDEKNTVQLIQLLTEIRASENMTLILVTHDAQLGSYCDRVYQLSKSVTD